MKYFFSFAEMDTDFARRAAIDAPESFDEIRERLRLLFGNSAFVHRASGLWPKNDQFFGRYRAIKCYVGIISTLVAVLMQFSLLTRIDKDETARFMMETGIGLSAVVKILACILNSVQHWLALLISINRETIIHSHRRGIIRLQQATYKVNSYARESPAEKRIAYRWLSLHKKLVSFTVVSYTCVYFTYLLTPLITGDIFPLPGLVPNVFRELPWFVVIYPIELIMSGLRCVLITSCDCYFVTFACQLFSELQLVQQAILDVDRRSVKRVIARHRRALEYGRMICRNYSMAIVVQHCELSIFACLGALSLLYLKNMALLYNFLGLLIMTATQLLLICLVGDKIAAESLKIGDSLDHVYAEFLGDVTSLKAILTMLTRAQRPLLLQVGEKFVIDLNLYRLTMANISSIFLVLKKFIDE